MLDTAKSGRPTIQLLDTSIEVQRADKIIELLHYPTMNTELKLKTFDPAMLNELQEIYLQIMTMNAHRGYTGERVFEYRRDWLEDKVKSLDAVIKKLD